MELITKHKQAISKLTVVYLLTQGMVAGLLQPEVKNYPSKKARLPPSVVAPTHDLVIYAFDTVSTVDLFTVGGTPSPKKLLKSVSEYDNTAPVDQDVPSKKTEEKVWCTVTNEWGSVMSPTITIKYWDKERMDSMLIVVCNHSYASIPCLQNIDYIQQMPPNITWYKDGIKIKYSKKYYIDLRGNLHIFNPTSYDAVDYFCTVAMSFPAMNFAFNVTLNRRLTSSHSDDVTTTTTTRKPTSRKSDSSSNSEDRHLDEDDDDDYSTTKATTTTTTTTTTATSKSNMTKHHSLRSNNGSNKLIIFYITSNKTYTYNATAILECLCAGTPLPYVQWRYANNQNSTKMLYNGRQLRIEKVRDDVNHTYKCVCFHKNSSMSIEKSTSFNVKSVLKWHKLYKSVNVTEWSTVTFNCAAHWSNGKKVRSKPQWYINNIPILGNISSKIRFKLSDDMTALTFTSVQWNDARTIQCKVTANNQSIFHSAYMNVLAKTKVQVRLAVMKTEERKVKLAVMISKDPLLLTEDFTVDWLITQYNERSFKLTGRLWISVNGSTTRRVQCIVRNQYQTVIKEIIIDAALKDTEIISAVPVDSLSWAKHLAWSSVLIVVIVSVLIILKMKYRWIEQKWKERKETQRLRFRMALADAINHSNKYEDIPRNSDEFPVERVRFLDTIGEGNFGKVMKAEALDINRSGTWELVAVKMWKDTATDSIKQLFYHEMLIMKKIPKYVHVVAYLGYNMKSDPAFIVMEYISGGDLLTFLRKRRPENAKKKQALLAGDATFGGCCTSMKDSTKVNEDTDDAKVNADVTTADLVSSKDLASFAMQICRGMEHLANNKIIHRDVAARNVLVGVGNVCKISDLGLARDVEGCDAYERSSLGPLPIRWMSPESLKDGLYTYKSDVWSFGVLLWEIVTLGASPYSGMSARQVMSAVIEGKCLEKPAFCSDDIYTIMTTCWSLDPDNRPTFSHLVKIMEKLLEQEAEYIQMADYEEGIYDVIDPSDVDIEDERL